MRIYETVVFNLKSIKFKENFDFIEKLLQGNGLQCRDISFCSNDANRPFERVKILN